MEEKNTCPVCGRNDLSDEQMTIAENGNPICVECAENEE